MATQLFRSTSPARIGRRNLRLGWAICLLALGLTGCRVRAFGLVSEWQHSRTFDTYYFEKLADDGVAIVKLTVSLVRRPAPSIYFGASLPWGDTRVDIYREYHRLREPRLAQPYAEYSQYP